MHQKQGRPGFPQKGLQEGQNARVSCEGYACVHREQGRAASPQASFAALPSVGGWGSRGGSAGLETERGDSNPLLQERVGGGNVNHHREERFLYQMP